MVVALTPNDDDTTGGTNDEPMDVGPNSDVPFDGAAVVIVAPCGDGNICDVLDVTPSVDTIGNASVASDVVNANIPGAHDDSISERKILLQRKRANVLASYYHSISRPHWITCNTHGTNRRSI